MVENLTIDDNKLLIESYEFQDKASYQYEETIGNKTYQFTKNVKPNMNDILMVLKVTSDDNLPKVTLPTDESGISELKCEKTNYSYKYLFDLDGLYSVTSRITFPYTNADEMANKKIELQKLVKSYSETEGITADTVEGDNKEVIYIEEVDYNVFSGELKEENIYSKGVKASVVKFKNESEGFTCNG